MQGHIGNMLARPTSVRKQKEQNQERAKATAFIEVPLGQARQGRVNCLN